MYLASAVPSVWPSVEATKPHCSRPGNGLSSYTIPSVCHAQGPLGAHEDTWPCQMLPLSQRDGVSLWKLPGLLRGAPCGSRQPHAQIWSVSYSPFTKGLLQGGVSRRLPSQAGRYLCAQSSPWALTRGGFPSSSVLEDEHITGLPSGGSSHSAQWAIGASSHVQLLRQASTIPASSTRCQE